MLSSNLCVWDFGAGKDFKISFVYLHVNYINVVLVFTPGIIAYVIHMLEFT